MSGRPSAGHAGTALAAGSAVVAAAVSAPGTTATDLAKAAFRRLAIAKLEPTPENYARAYAQEAGVRGEETPAAGSGLSVDPGSGTGATAASVAAATGGVTAVAPHAATSATSNAAEVESQARLQAASWATLTERVARNLQRVGKQWTAARRKESLGRVFDGSRSDATRLQQRLQGLMKAWEEDLPADGVELGEGFESIIDPLHTAPMPLGGVSGGARSAMPGSAAGQAWPEVVTSLEGTLRAALPAHEPSAAALAQRLSVVAQALARDGATAAHVAQVDALCGQARRWLGQRHHLVQQLSRLCRELGVGLAEMVEDGSWVQGQCEAVVGCLQSAEGGEPNLRAVRSASALLAEARQRQRGVRGERAAAQLALKELIQKMLLEVGELGEHTGRFQMATAAHVQAIEEARSLESLAGVVKSLLSDSRAVQAAVQRSSTRLHADQSRASELEARVRELESELRRLSDEVLTDALTKVANRRGLAQAFETECARLQRDGGTGLSVGLIDIDNFKKLNDSLGHAAGDLALQSLATQVQSRLRPTDHLARFGGEEFVVLIPGTAAAEAQQALTRLQRSLSEALFLHEGREVFVTFSAGVTAWQPGETLEDALARADMAMYEAKRTGKNKTCLA